jgi:hypothetical protein
MKRLFALLLVTLAPAIVRADPTPPIQVMIVGTYHFGNPGHDLHNVEADDVTSPRRQQELAELAKRLESWKPTRVAVEADGEGMALTLAKYRAFTPADLGKSKNEIVQLGFRVAREMWLADVYGIDESSDTVDYFPYGKVDAYAKQHAVEAKLAAMQARVEKMTRELTAAQRSKPVGQLLASLNEPAEVRAMQDDFYYGLLAFGDARSQPGAELNAMWYMRNAKIFSKLMRIAKPGDRVLVVFGAGHLFWLRHFVEHTPGFQLVEPNAYLK